MIKSYTVMTSWVEVRKYKYIRKNKTHYNLMAASMEEAGRKALEPIKNKICPAINCIWYDY